MKKTVYKKFFLWRSDEEEAWLNSMSEKGWQLIHVAPLRYRFESGQPNLYSYKLELLDQDPGHADSRAYLDFLKETGTEKVGQVGNWVYLRRKTSDGAFETTRNALAQLTYIYRVEAVVDKMRNMLVAVIAVSLLISQIAIHVDYSAPLFDFFMGFFDGVTIGCVIVLLLMTPYQKRMQKYIRTLFKEIAVRE